MEVSVLLRTERFLGDHAEFVTVAHDVEPDETVEHLVNRLLSKTRRTWDSTKKKTVNVFDGHVFTDHIELRIVTPVSNVPTAEGGTT